MEGNGGGGSVVRSVTPSSQFQDRLVLALNNKETENRGLKVQVQNLQENLNGRNNCLQYLDSGINQLIETLRLTSSNGDSGDNGGSGECSSSGGGGGGGDGGGGGGGNNSQVDFYTVLNIPGDLFEEMAQQHFQNKLGELSKLFWGSVEGLSGKLEKAEKDLKKAREQIGNFWQMMGRSNIDPVHKRRLMGFNGSPKPVPDCSGIGMENGKREGSSQSSGESGVGMEMAEEDEETVDLNGEDPLETGNGGQRREESFEEEQSGEDEESVGEEMETEGGVGSGVEADTREQGIDVGRLPYPVVVKVEPGTCPVEGYRQPRKCKAVRHARDWNHRGLRILCLCGIAFLTKKAFERHLSRSKVKKNTVGGGDGQQQEQDSSSGMNGERNDGGEEGSEMPTSSAEMVKVDGRRRQRINNLEAGRRVSTSPERKQRRKRGPYMTKMTRTKRKAGGGAPVPDSTSQLAVGHMPGRRRGRKPSKTKEIRFECGICEQQFKSVSLVKNHKKNAHNVKDEVFKIGCKECGRVFFKREDFAKHRISEHGTQYGSSKNRQSESPRSQVQSEPQEPKRKRRRRSRNVAVEEEAESVAPSEMENAGEEEEEEVNGGDGEEMEETLEEENTEVWANGEGEEEEGEEDSANVNGSVEESVDEVAEPDETPPVKLPEQVAAAGEMTTVGGTRANSNGNLNDLVRFACTVCNEEFRSRGCLQLHMGQKHTVGMPKLKKKSSLMRKSVGESTGDSAKVTPVKKVSFNLPPDLAGSADVEEEGDEEDSKEGVLAMAQQANGGEAVEAGAPLEEGDNPNAMSPERETPHFVATIPLGGQAPGATASPVVVVKTEAEEQQEQQAE